jgi:hypothetical protein
VKSSEQVSSFGSGCLTPRTPSTSNQTLETFAHETIETKKPLPEIGLKPGDTIVFITINRVEVNKVKQIRISSTQQQGFFDLGLSLLILAMAGAIALSANQAQDETMVLQQNEARIAETQRSETPDNAVTATANLGTDIQ